MTNAQEFRDYVQDNRDDEALLDIFTKCGSRIRRHEITHEDSRRVISGITFQDGSSLAIDLAKSGDRLAFMPNNIQGPQDTVIFHPEESGKPIFALVAAVQTSIRTRDPMLQDSIPLFNSPNMENVLWHLLKHTEEKTILDWNPQDGPAPIDDWSGMNDPSVTPCQAFRQIPGLPERLKELRMSASLEREYGLMLHDLARHAAHRLLNLLMPAERGQLEQLTRQTLREAEAQD